MRLLPVVALALLVGCGSSTTPPTSSDAGAGGNGGGGGGGGASGGGAPVVVDDVTVHVAASFCFPVPGATVELVDGAAQGTTDVGGNAKLGGLPTTGSLLVRSEGHVDSLTSVRTFTAGSTVTVYPTPRLYHALAYLGAGLTPDPERGSVVLSVINEAALPISGVEVDLVGGGDDKGTRRYVSGTSLATLGFDDAATETQPHVGFVVFLNVPPGVYQLVAKRAADVFPPMTVEVRAGLVTGDDLVRPGNAGTDPSPVGGTLRVTPPIPAYGPAGPAANLPFTLHDVAQGTDQELVTGADGTYALTLPFARSTIDLTVSQAPYGVVRTLEWCVGPLTEPFDWTFDDRFWHDQVLAPSLAGGTKDPTRGSLAMRVYDSTGKVGLAGATLGLDPAAGAPYYAPAAQPGCVAAPTCGTTADCPANSRCEGGECLVGAAAPTCSLCGTACPTGHAPSIWTEGPASVCRCLPTRADCEAPTPSCDPGMYCTVGYSLATSTLTIGQPACYPLGPSAGATTVDASGLPTWVGVSNLAPGEYSAMSMVGGATKSLNRLRVSAGTTTFYGSWVSAD